ncbi:heme-binding protein [Mycolicibacterium chubuense]|uniref:SOUL heme-binding protein n=1 Tax=Mycolicibacterium chubuense TaxID=1800 RepID=A0A0J6VP10_MYCCU|nr:heme-binding protein [Mycolicibacterium chubuense]KMO72785.1 SOUL heme-binding protein [Mycolicibacterium chubuense]ORA46772.1 heme-binding protein [Mycolicibacterium chubuense]SPX99709.1 SOUL heme-binding protein [Mycolicibacterium chubuense]
MVNRIVKFAGQLGESALSIVGVRTVEEPHYIKRPLTDTVEIRQYGSRIAAETTVSGDKQKALNTGFRRLAGYIFGGNHRDTEIAMTAPVSQQSAKEEIAMTAPVSQTGSAEDGWTVRFFMPSKWSMETLPEPDDENVRLVTVPPQTVAVLKFTGDRSAAAIARRGEELRTTLRDKGIEPVGETTAWFYDPPWTLPFRRRNEVAVGI